MPREGGAALHKDLCRRAKARYVGRSTHVSTRGSTLSCFEYKSALRKAGSEVQEPGVQFGGRVHV